MGPTARISRGQKGWPGGGRLQAVLCAAVVAVAVLCCMLVVAATPAPAETTHKLLRDFSGSSTPAGSFHPETVFLDESGGTNAGDLYIGDGPHEVLDRFSASGTYECQITGAGSATTSPSECDSLSAGSPSGSLSSFLQSGAVDPTTGNVYLPAGGAIDVFSPAGAYLSQIPASGAVSFSASTGELLIGEAQVVDEYDPSTSTLNQFASGTPGGPFGRISDVAVDNDSSSPAYGDVYVADQGNGTIDVFDSSGSFLRTITGVPGNPFPAAGEPERLAVDPASGELYVFAKSQGSAAHVLYQFDAAGAFMGRLRLNEAFGDIAVDGLTADLYVTDLLNNVIHVYGPDEIIPTVATAAATGVEAKGATLEGSVNPDGQQVTDCHFDYGTSSAYGQTAPCVPGAASIGSDSSDHTVTADLGGLLEPGTTYHFRLEASNANGTNFGEDLSFSTTPPPTITEAKVSGLTATSADLGARINPSGNETTYRIEWGTSTAYGHTTPIPDSNVGSGTSPVAVKQHIEGLSPETTYHWRVVATNLAATTTGGDHTFVYDTTPAALPDERAYELVTPVQKNGSQFDAGLILLQPLVAEDGDRVMVAAIQCFPGATSCTATREPEGSLWSLDRTAEGWQATAASPPATQFEASSIKNGSIDVNAGTGIFSSTGASGGKDQLVSRGPDGSFTVIGPVQAPSSDGIGAAAFAETSSDLSYVVFEGHSENLDWPFDTSLRGGFTSSVFEYEGAGNSQPFLVGVNGGRGSTDLVSECGTNQNALSSDGRTVIFTADGHLSEQEHPCPPSAVAPAATEVLARIEESETILLSGRSPSECSLPACQSSASRPAAFDSASKDGSRILFSSQQQLADSATQGSGNLYLYDFTQPPGQELIDVSAGDTSGGGPDLKGVMAFSEDGSHAYFVAGGVLGGGLDGLGQPPVEGANNLYDYERDAAHPSGHLNFIARLPDSDQGYWSKTGIAANVTPDGRFLVFPSHGKLTSDDVSENGAAQIFRYSAENGQLLRISIGEAGFNDNGNAGGVSLCAGQPSSCTADASLAPVPFQRRDPTMSHDGAYVFFQSPAALAPGALDFAELKKVEGKPIYGQNVYEYHDGHVYLISDGEDLAAGHGEGPLIGTDARGSNVFFKTFDPLVPSDTDGGQLDIYDARIGGGFPPPVAPVPCEGDACRGAASATPQGPAPGSSSFEGPGNLRPRAHKAHAKKHRHHHRKKRHPRRRTAGNHRRTSR